MTSIATTRLRLDKQATGDNPDAWGERLNASMDLVDEAFGFAEIAVNGNVTLSTANFTSDQARRMILRFTGAGGFSVTIPAIEKLYYIDNRCSADVTLKTSSTPGSAVVAGTKRIAYCDGATVTTDTSTSAPPASAISVTPAGGISSTNVQAALVELDNEKAPKNNATFTGSMTLPNAAVFAAGGGIEGGELRLAKPASGTTLASDVVVDVVNNTFRVFESTGPFRGFSVDLAGCGSQSNLWHTGNFAPGNYALLTGAGFSGAVSAEGLFVLSNDDTAKGGVRLVAGGANNSGYLEFTKGDGDPGSRHGYIGFAPSNGVINLSSETQNGYFNFVGNHPRVGGQHIAVNGHDASFNTVAVTQNGTGNSLKIGDDATMGDVNVADTVGLRGTRSPAQGYLAMGSGGAKFGYNSSDWTFEGGGNIYFRSAVGSGTFHGMWHAGNFNPSTKATLGEGSNVLFGDIRANRANSDTGAIYLGDGERYLFYDGANYYLHGAQLFVNGSQVWKRDDFNPGNYVAKGGDTLTGNLDIQKSDAQLRLTYPGIRHWDLRVQNDGYLHFVPNGAAGSQSFLAGDGNLWGKAFGETWITNYIGAQASAAASAAAVLRQAAIPTLVSGSARRINVNGNVYLSGTASVVLDDDYNAVVTYPWAFATVDTVIACNGDFATGRAGNATVAVVFGGTGGFAVHVNDGTNLQGVTVRINYYAVGS